MIRLLVWGLIGWLVYRGLRSLGAGAVGRGSPAGARGGAENMVRCRACGLNVPESEAIDAGGGRWACCEDHARRVADPSSRA